MNLFLTKSNVAIHYETVGKGFPIVLIHGAFQDMGVFEPVVKRLSKNYQVITIDLRGHGLSDTTFDSRVDNYVCDLHELLKGLYINKAFIIGMELGATIATGFTYKYSDIVQGLTLINPTTDHGTFPEQRIYSRHADKIRTMTEEEREKYLIKFRYKNIKQVKKFIKSNFPTHELQTVEEEETIRRSFKDFDIISLLPHIHVPALIISGQYDGKILSHEGKTISEKLPNAQFEQFQHSGELPYIEEKEQFFKVVEKFLKENE